MPLLPAPLRLQSSFVWKNRLGGLVLILAGIGAAVGFGWYESGAVKELLDQSRIWQEGTPAWRTEVSGHVTSHDFVLNEYDLNVTFVDANQVSHDNNVKFDTFIGKVDQEREPMVHYLPNDPDRFALSWAIDAKTSRWSAIVFMAVIGIGLIGGAFTFLGWLALRRLSDAKACASRPDEVILRIAKIVPTIVKGKQTGNEYHFTGHTLAGREITGKTVFALKYEPLFADAAKQAVLALVPQENVKRPLVLRGDFYPFDLSPDDQARVRAAIAARIAAGS
ncbi:MAG TPA: hypothetical protein VMI53_10070 [Opitutaceae bacterium]|nr:hypothetical protein [Opitutaceae bacterium]